MKKMRYLLSAFLIFAVIFACKKEEKKKQQKAIPKDEILLRYNPTVGEAFDYHANIEVTMKMLFIGTDIDMYMDFSSEAIAKNEREDSEVELICKRAGLKLPMLGVEYNTDDKKVNPKMKKMDKTFREIIGKPFKITMNEYGEMVNTQSMEEILRKKGGQEEIQIKQILELMSNSFPDNALKIGESWEVVSEMETQLGEVTLKKIFTIKSITNDEVTLDISGGTVDDANVDMDIEGMLVLGKENGVVHKIDMDQKAEFSLEGQEVSMKSEIEINKIN